MEHENEILTGKQILEGWNNDNITASDHAGFEIELDVEYEVHYPDYMLKPQLNSDCVIMG